MVKNRLFEPFLVVFVLFEILELFEYLMAKYSIFEVQLFLLELEALVDTKYTFYDKCFQSQLSKQKRIELGYPKKKQ